MYNTLRIYIYKHSTHLTAVSCMEIYNEEVTDLLDRTNTHDLKIREHPNKGHYVQYI